MAATLLWPIRVLPPQDVTFEIAPRTLAGPASVSGISQVVASDAGLWRATYTNVMVNRRKREPVLAFRSIAARLEGPLHPILLPVCRGYQPYAPEWKGLYEPVPHSDDSPFCDGSEYQGGVIDVTLVSNIPLRGTTAMIAIHVAHEIQPGQHFSIDERLYRIRSIEYSGESEATITFRPPAREPALIGTRLEFDAPVCRMRLASDNEMNLSLGVSSWSYVSINFIEDV